jgi:hypothetical protein
MVVGEPSPRSIVTVKSEGGAVGSPSEKQATVSPVRGIPLDRLGSGGTPATANGASDTLADVSGDNETLRRMMIKR